MRMDNRSWIVRDKEENKKTGVKDDKNAKVSDDG